VTLLFYSLDWFDPIGVANLFTALTPVFAICTA